ncbi:1-deoxy-D-xylulose-5-phosphate synthase N-terminal domain-containing protein [Streptomyces sp. NPDC048717]|uniref:1-deoxy-D-xylulose-5-phosphate synthase N-terminal domain-containing protein n=1 Tax=Streptomyces sp. NPDC048717 TaxID=3154928 RepID=UPI003441FE52
MDRSLAWIPRTEFERVLDHVGDPHDRALAFAALTRVNTLYMITRAGSGHIGSSFSAADVVGWLLLEELDRPFEAGGDVYFSSKGHDAPGLYAAMIALGHLDEELLHRLRRIDGLPGHPDTGTPGMPFNTGSLGMGISKAKGLILAHRLAGRTSRVVVMTGDGELQEGQNWEALPSAARYGMGELTVVVDHNRLQSDTFVTDVSDLGDLRGKFTAAGWGVLRCDGHDPRQLQEAFARRAADHPDQPVVIIADTVKGGGCPTFAATSMVPGEWRYRHHSGAPSPADHDAAYRELTATAEEILARHGLAPLRPVVQAVDLPAKPAAVRLPELYGRLLTEAAHDDPGIVALDGDLVLDTGLIPFREAHPDRFVECGIAEQDMVSMAGGLAAGGMRPFVHSFSCFLHARPNEHIYNNATERRPVVYVGSLAGLLPAGPGHSHQAVRDVSALCAVPGLAILEPSHPAQLEAAVRYCRTTPDSVYLRLSSQPVPAELVELPPAPLVVGQGRVLRGAGAGPVAIGAGPVVLAQLLGAAELLAGRGVALTVVDLPWHNRIDPAWLSGLLTGARHLFVVEHQFDRGGQADLIARHLLETGAGDGTAFRGIGLTEVPRCGTEAEVLAAHGMDAAHLADLIGADVKG